MTPSIPSGSRQPAPFQHPDVPGSAAVRTIGVVLIAFAVLRLGFVATTLVRMPYSVFSGPAFLPFLIQAVILPAALGIASLVAGILAVMQLPLARPLGLTVCLVVVLFQLYVAGRIVYLVTTHVLRLELLTWTVWVTPVFLLVHAAAVLVFLRWKPAPRSFPGT